MPKVEPVLPGGLSHRGRGTFSWDDAQRVEDLFVHDGVSQFLHTIGQCPGQGVDALRDRAQPFRATASGQSGLRLKAR